MTAIGPIFASGGYEAGVGDVRIPWFGANEPAFNVAVECLVCGRSVPGGTLLRVDGKSFGFCTNRHYIDWWKLHHTDPSIDTSFLNTAEFYWMEQDGDE